MNKCINTLLVGLFLVVMLWASPGAYASVEFLGEGAYRQKNGELSRVMAVQVDYNPDTRGCAFYVEPMDTYFTGTVISTKVAAGRRVYVVKDSKGVLWYLVRVRDL